MIGRVAKEGRIVEYHDVPPRALFRALVPETSFTGKVVPNIGIFVKIGNSHAVDFVRGKDAIFALTMPCRIVNTRVDSSHLPDWKLIDQGNPKRHGL